MGMALYLLGALVAFVGGIWIVVNAFKKSVLWGLGALFVPFVSLIFAIMNWEQNKKPFLIAIAGVVIMIIGVVMLGGTAAMSSGAGMPS